MVYSVAMKISSVNALLTTWLCLVSLSNGSRRSTSTTPYVDYRNLVEVVASLSNRLDLLSARVSRLLPPNPPPSSPPRRHQFSGASDQGQPLLTTEGVYRPDSWFRKRTQVRQLPITVYMYIHCMHVYTLYTCIPLCIPIGILYGIQCKLG